ncbi:ubiquinol-cytochrome c reductase core subunit 1 [Arachnomyces sp. PD_36]|nr:ubiquinol-cytochrome c reductase core subunit 1 [Arachnomyces sp. PD_36]
MLSRSTLGRNGPRALRKQCTAQPLGNRGMAAAAAPQAKGFQYESGEAAGVKFASRDLPGPTTTLKVVAKAGSRYQPFFGYSEALAKFAFLSTTKRSALRITRESELLGGELSSNHSRENIVLSARFLSEDLPYFTELLGEVVSSTKYASHEMNEQVLNLINFSQRDLTSSPADLALSSAHGVAFHHGLGEQPTPTPGNPITKYLTVEGLAEYAQGAYAKPSLAVVASGANSADVSKWVGQFFKDVPAGPSSSAFKPLESKPTQYFGGEERIANTAGNAVVIAFPGSASFGTAGSAYKPEVAVLAALLGGQSSIKWSTGSSLLSKAVEAYPLANVRTNHVSYSDAGLLYVTVTGGAEHVGKASKSVVDTLKKVAAGEVSAEDVKRATALAKFRTLEAGQALDTGMELTGTGLLHGGKPFQIAEVGQSIDSVTEQQVKNAAKSLLSNKASVSSVGDLSHLPYASDLGLSI